MKEKGFTLIELLAVIIILSIIALIAVPVVSNIIASTRVKAAETTTLAVLRAAKIYYGNEEISGTFTGAKFKCDGSSCKKCTNATCSTTDTNTILKFEGTVPDSGIIEITEEGNAYIVSTLYYADNKAYVGYDNKGIIKGSSIETEVLTNAEVNGIFSSCIIAGNCEYGNLIGTEIKFDPVNDTICTTGTTCYTWNVIGYNGVSADIMMNENFGSNVQWNENMICDEIEGFINCTNTSPATILTALDTRTSTWKYKARIIEAEEVLGIINKTDLGVYMGNDYEHYCDVIDCTLDMTVYGWLINNANDTQFSSDEDVYWTGTIVSTDETEAYEIRHGLSCSSIHNLGDIYAHGIRPVITIAKTLLN